MATGRLFMQNQRPAFSSAQGLSTNYSHSFIDAGATGGILGASGKNTGGWQLTTASSMGAATSTKPTTSTC